MQHRTMCALCVWIGIVLLTTTGCRKAADVADWENAAKNDTADGYRKYLLAHPQSKLAEKAREALDWHDAVSSNTAGSYEAFLTAHPQSQHADQAVRRIGDFAGAAKSPDDALFEGVRRGWPTFVQKALEKGADVNARQNQDVTALHRAASKGNPRVISLLLQKGAHVNARALDKLTPLHWATADNREEVVKLLIAAGADVNARDDAGETPLHWAARKNYQGIGQLLLAKGAEANVRNDSKLTALQVAAYRGSTESVDVLRKHGIIEPEYGLLDAVKHNDAAKLQSLMSQGVKADAPAGIYRSTPLHWAAAECKKGLVEHMLARHANIEAKDEAEATPLHYAVRGGCVATVELLLAKGASVRAEATKPGVSVYTSGGLTTVSARRIETISGAPLHWAAATGQTEIAERLTSAHADINAKNQSHWTPVYLAAERGHFEMVKLLHSKGARLNVNDDLQGSPLHFAASRPIAEFLVAAGASPSVTSTYYGTPLHQAAYDGRKEVVEYLLATGLKSDALGTWLLTTTDISEPVTPAYCAALGGRLDVLKQLEARGAKLNFSTPGKSGYREGGTLLHAAAWGGAAEVAEYLIAKRVGVDTTGDMPSGVPFTLPRMGITPLAVAADQGNLAVVSVLLAKGANVNAKDDQGFTALDLAANDEIRSILEKHGAKSGK